MNRLVPAGLALTALVSVAACGSGGLGSSGDGAGKVTLTVFAASSLTDTFTELGRQFEADHEGADVAFNFAGSSDLVAQIQQGAPADVFASADTTNMEKAVSDGLTATDPVVFASNTLEIAVPPDNPADVQSLRDLADPGVTVVLCAPEVPCGAAAVAVEEAAGIDIPPVSEEASVTDVLNKVVTGEADAGLVYVTDVVGAGDDVSGIDFPEASEAVNAYPIVALADSEHGGLAQEFVDLVTSETGQAVLAERGFASAP